VGQGSRMKNNLQSEIIRKLKEAKDLSTTNPDKSYELCIKLYQLSKENHLKSEEAYALLGMSMACRVKSENHKMLEYTFHALGILNELNDTIGVVRSLNLIGIAYFYSSMYEQALNYLRQAMDLLETCKDDFLMSCVLNNIGEVFRETLQFDVALEYYQKTLNLCYNSDLKINAASILSNIGEIYFLRNQHSKAMDYFAQSYEILNQEKDMVILSEVENRLGKVYYVNKESEKAKDYFIKALKKIDSISNKFYAIDILLNIAMLEFEKDKKASFYYLDKAKQYAEETNAKKKLSMVLKTAADYYEKTGDFETALAYYKKYHGVEQEVTALLIGNKLEILKLEFEHLDGKQKYTNNELMDQRLEMEILNQRRELEKIQQLNQKLEEKLYEDELTQVPNRRYINKHLNKTWEEADSDLIVVLFIIDIDNFKKYNDCWGHPEGDKCLIKVANCLKEIQTKRKDVFARYGGEEFLYYAENINYDQAKELGDLLRNEVENLALSYSIENDSQILTISVGGVFGRIANYDKLTNMIQIADKELYKGKSMGRNRTFIKNMFES
jgi:diguanylate cyclase (GGDEF)-like protein